MKSALGGILMGVIAFVLVLMVTTRFGGGGGSTALPAVLQSSVDLQKAVEMSKSSGKPIMVLSTAHWCPPCQALKRDTLSDERVTGIIESSLIPVVLLDENPAERAASGELGVTGYPTTMIIADGEVISRHVGYASARDYSMFLETSVKMIAEKKGVRAQADTAPAVGEASGFKSAEASTNQ